MKQMQCNATPLKQPQNKFSRIFILIIAELHCQDTRALSQDFRLF